MKPHACFEYSRDVAIMVRMSCFIAPVALQTCLMMRRCLMDSNDYPIIVEPLPYAVEIYGRTESDIISFCQDLDMLSISVSDLSRICFTQI